MAEEYCAVDPDRLIGVAVLPNIGTDPAKIAYGFSRRTGVHKNDNEETPQA